MGTPYGRKRAPREERNNPFKYIDRYFTDRREKCLSNLAEVDALRLASGAESRLLAGTHPETAARPNESRSGQVGLRT